MLLVQAAFAAFQVVAAAPQSGSQGGLAVEFRVSSQSGGETLDSQSGAVVEVTVKDARTHQPVTGLRPSLWFDRRRSNGLAEESSCADKAKAFSSGKIGLQADVDLNSFLLVTLNTDSSVTFINPMVRFEPTRLESIVALPGRPLDWAATPGDRLLAITIPEQRKVAIVDTLTRKLAAVVDTPAGKPSRIVVSPLGRLAFAGLDGSGQVAVIDVIDGKLVRTLSTGGGMHGLAISDDSAYLAVTSTESNAVDLFDAVTLRHLRKVDAGPTPVAIAWSSASRQFYAAALNAPVVHVIDPASERAATIPAVRGIAHLGVEPSGRFVVAASQTEGKVLLIDTSSNGVAATAVIDSPDQTVFSNVFAAVRSVRANKWTLFDLGEIRAGRLQPAEAAVGRESPSSQPADLGVAGMAAPLPGGRMLAMASAGDRMIYTMAGAKYIGTHRNYERAPLGIRVLDHGLVESSPGVYAAAVRFPFGGRFDVPVVIAQPPSQFCFSAEVKGPKRAESARSPATASVRPVTPSAAAKPGEPLTLQFRFTDRDSAAPLTGLRDARVVIVRLPSRRFQAWMKEVEPGLYEAAHAFEEEGDYEALAAADSVRLGSHESPSVKIKVRRP